MSEHKSRTSWKRTTADFAPETYSRTHTWTLGSGQSIEASAAPEYKGDATKTNPEEGLVAAASSCHMLTFLAFCARKQLVVDSYDDDAVGVLEKGADGRIAVTRITLRPKVVFADGASVSREDLERLHDQAHRGCFIANSIKSEVLVDLG